METPAIILVRVSVEDIQEIKPEVVTDYSKQWSKKLHSKLYITQSEVSKSKSLFLWNVRTGVNQWISVVEV